MSCRSRPTDPPSRHAGFGLLEALVALVLLAGVGFALLAWVQQNLDTLQRMQGLYGDLETRRTVIRWSRTLNPMAQPDGETRLGQLRLTWRATATGDVVTQAGFPRGMGLYDLALYQVDISVYRDAESTPFLAEKVVRVGYRKARMAELPPFLRN